MPETLGRRWWPWLVLVPGILAAGGVLVTLLAPWWWKAELASHWAPHVIVMTLLAAAVLSRRCPAWAGVLLVVAVVGIMARLPGGWRPRAPMAEVGIPVAHGNLFLYNDKQRRPEAVAAVLAGDPEIVSLVESVASEDRPRIDLTRYPYQVWQPQPRRKWRDSVALLSQHPIRAHTVHDAEGQPFLAATLEVHGRPLHVLVVHTASPANFLMWKHRAEQLQHVGAVVEALVAQVPAPVLALGDFNCTPRSPLWTPLTTAGLLTSGSTPPTWGGWLGIPIDHVLGRDLAIGQVAAFSIPGSDHRGLRGVVAWPPR